MYFKHLEMVGFKSFPHKTKIKFETGVTAVVGPNGCGKSNIADAIKWVLGEQSPRSLRGFSMEDVIFNGTDLIEPINMAEVSLTLSNESKSLPIDYEEVTITRRLFRSGESEYILNKTPVRLKDITSLLMGTGMGTNSYSMIEQGKIDLILSSKPEERRYVFEEASGITKYKSKKTEALRKLEHTENNLLRINDIINEVKRQINSIERHAKKAERYKNDFEIMKDLDLKLAVYELKNIQRELEENNRQLISLRQKEESLAREKDEIAKLISKYREELDNIIHDLTQTQQKFSETNLFIEKGKHKVELNKERINELTSLKDSLEKELKGLEEKLRFQEEELVQINRRRSSVLKTREEKEKGLVKKENIVEGLSHEINAHEKDIKDAKNKIVDLLAVQTKIKNELIKLGADLATRKSRLRRLEIERENVQEERKGIESLLDGINKELDTCKKKVQESLYLLNDRKKHIASCEQTLEEVKKRIIGYGNTLNSLESKEEILKEMMERFEGFDKGVKFIMDAVKNGTLKGIIGLVANIIEPENGYELALEIALDNKAQAIIVENKEALKEALNFVGEKGSSAHFIVYEDIKNTKTQSPHKAIMKKNNIPSLFSFVKVDSSYKDIIEYLINDIYVADSREKAYEILSTRKENIRFVTKDGSRIERGYIFAPYPAKNESAVSIIGRAKRLEEIRNQKIELENNIETLKSKEDEQCGTLRALKQEIGLAEDKLKKEEIVLANVLSKKESVEGNLKKIHDESSIIELEAGEVGDFINEISLKGNGLNKNLNENEDEHRKVQEFISSSQDAIQNKTKIKNDRIFEISEIKSEINFLKNTEEQEAKNLDRETVLLDELKTQYEAKNKNVQDCENKITQLTAETESLEEEIERKGSEEMNLREKLEGISKTKGMLLQDLHNKEGVYREKEKFMEGWRNEIRDLQIKTREGELKIINIRDRIREAYKMDIEGIDMQVEDGTNWEDVRNQIEVLNIKLEKLGPVNLVAIEEHKELEERYSFLTQQQEDLLMAKESLHKAITKINNTTKKLFIETFGKIQVEFRNYFRMLFGGGHAELILLDESDILECGIEIVARPPGKKLQNLLLLSGGEKALTAIALLFAIFKVKPSPFCILDEVDAPLDESNIGRFLQVLQEFLKMSQFIVITHSKKTMQMATVLYGITMEEKGVSKIISVKFADDNKASSKKEEVLV